jgi:hypothetical protein
MFGRRYLSLIRLFFHLPLILYVNLALTNKAAFFLLCSTDTVFIITYNHVFQYAERPLSILCSAWGGLEQIFPTSDGPASLWSAKLFPAATTMSASFRLTVALLTSLQDTEVSAVASSPHYRIQRSVLWPLHLTTDTEISNVELLISLQDKRSVLWPPHLTTGYRGQRCGLFTLLQGTEVSDVALLISLQDTEVSAVASSPHFRIQRSELWPPHLTSEYRGQCCGLFTLLQVQRSVMWGSSSHCRIQRSVMWPPHLTTGYRGQRCGLFTLLQGT